MTEKEFAELMLDVACIAWIAVDDIKYEQLLTIRANVITNEGPGLHLELRKRFID